MTANSVRSLFSIPRNVCYLNAAYMTPHPTAVTAACRAGIERRTAPWEISPGEFFTDVETLRSLFASLLGAAPDNIAIVPAASYGVACAANNVSVSQNQKILVLAEQFPSHYYAWARLAEENGAELCIVYAPADLDWTSAILDAISTHKDDIAIAAFPTTTGQTVRRWTCKKYAAHCATSAQKLCLTSRRPWAPAR